MMRITDTVKHIIIVNVILCLATVVLAGRGIDISRYLALFFTDNPNFGFWQPVTSMFMHSITSPTHILFNMFALWMFGSRLEMEWGTGKFLAFYFITGIGAGLLHTIVNYYGVYSNVSILVDAGYNKADIFSVLNKGSFYYSTLWENVLTPDQLLKLLKSYNTPAIGASGAIYGVMVAYAMTYPNEKLMLLFPPIPIKAMYLVGGLVTYDFLAGFFGGTGIFREGNIAHFAHLGGALAGFLLMWYFNKTQFNKNRWN
ncbi:rhomboid family intramembrane serine protease [Kordia sp. YSTF-M3]|uniref:Rhomboid family intramembrane serine protease n=1 Tax=Kordia aestuariivivens TaxID=2759037 RepID=A0ABR7Q5C9_9FLAO|nr:rhomboid family intramembrane serine protease [Kordia aestuariivivens]MBC8753727.1 rhomboid family intramembrane serine protease [Kordia aestuariivivens]